MNQDELTSFLLQTGARDLLEYLELPEHFSVGELDDALARRRRWCQGQQGNPKHRDHARWFIRNTGGIRHQLTVGLPAYRQGRAQQRRQVALVFLTQFRETLADVLDEPEVARVAALYEERLGLIAPEPVLVSVQVEVDPTLVPDLTELDELYASSTG